MDIKSVSNDLLQMRYAEHAPIGKAEAALITQAGSEDSLRGTVLNNMRQTQQTENGGPAPQTTLTFGEEHTSQLQHL